MTKHEKYNIEYFYYKLCSFVMVTNSLFDLKSDYFIQFKFRPRMITYGLICLRVLQLSKAM